MRYTSGMHLESVIALGTAWLSHPAGIGLQNGQTPMPPARHTMYQVSSDLMLEPLVPAAHTSLLKATTDVS